MANTQPTKDFIKVQNSRGASQPEVAEDFKTDLHWINIQLGFLMGDILTIVEASISDQEQRKAMKDVMRGAFNRKMNHITEIVTGINGAFVENDGQISRPATIAK